jgi:hypothetical protein
MPSSRSPGSTVSVRTPPSLAHDACSTRRFPFAVSVGNATMIVGEAIRG